MVFGVDIARVIAVGPGVRWMRILGIVGLRVEGRWRLRVDGKLRGVVSGMTVDICGGI